MDREAAVQEIIACESSPLYFVTKHVLLENVIAGGWIPFDLWPAQARVLKQMQLGKRLLVILKARQLGMTWLALAYALWEMVYRAPAHVLLFSLRDNEATDLLDRLVRMYKRLPGWMHAEEIESESGHEFRVSNGSRAQAFPTSAGDSYTASLVIVDEADLVPDLNRLMAKVKPTIDAGGKLFLVGRVQMDTPMSPFKRVFRAAMADPESEWEPIFLPWNARPERDEAWYAAIRREILTRTGSLDELHEQYPATIAEALSPRTLDKRLPPEWLQEAYVAIEPLEPKDEPAITGLRVFVRKQAGMRYAIGVDPAEGNPNSDESSVSVMTVNGEEVAVLPLLTDPAVTAENAMVLSSYYNNAPILAERNNHGHAFIQYVRERNGTRLLQGHDASSDVNRPKYGWLNSTRGKALMYSHMADGLREHEIIIHDWATYEQLASIDGNTLSAPEGMHDDRATSFALAYIGTMVPFGPPPQVEIVFRRG